ncbi:MULTISPECIES: polyribonucleotide nucleotidyltransferase [Acidaminococcus]|jgi:polyribonucleotide nucleotidyltransferase|uniref:Polyribonucleotide nucleotidyltransferase n=1 Tax=Acidaminococcus fermentans TaxID=905 RepID=A0A6N7W0A3_ACIFE|nr:MULTISPECIES: polyribonucleotide nucleotidyltransferase [Acidaminococcus]MEE1598784.1 polyribonucleotide nucleotidyltransferase [Acidaminococcus fermentans]MEE4123046.1 polyribonucleotide nucleotidyltransferase [Acidaminococcus fermentans]MSS81548.1 polyribonucleotide nucleotidyltransferase [Acidaminococcus fermentans]CDE94074.1 polyribonucleotide nucleotidyltransferase [Acidaminococcus sp. CAG:542]
MHSFSTDFGGRTLTIETGKIAKQANGAVLVRYGETAVVVAVTGTDTPREGVDFFPLTVDFEEKMYAVGKIPGGFLRREGRPAETAILTSRLIDRPIRPMFPDGYHNDVQIVCTAVSVDPDNAPDIPAMIGASCALSISDIPFEGPIAGVRVGLIDGQFIVEPTVEQAKVSELNLAVAGTKDAILMVEAGAKEVSEEVMLDAIWFAHGEIKKLVEFQEKIQAEVGKPKMDFEVYTPPAELAQEIEAYGEPKIHDALMDPDKLHRDKMVSEAKEEILAHFTELYPDNEIDIAHVVAKLVKRVFRHIITVDKIRPDGRALDEVRPISCEVGLLARPHGCSLFTRGQTQVLNCLALAPLREAQNLETLAGDIQKRYIHHYNFPPYSVGETKPLRSPGRREIGHGALAERALLPVIPSEEEFPYTIRLVSEVLESNGSSSMASTCASTLSLMDAGVPIKAPVSGVAMGLVKEGENFTILTDIQGLEDANGDMDFKVAGTSKGITAIQMDIKVDGLTKDILQAALAQAKKGRAFILGKMLECISEPRKQLKKYAPKITTIKVNPEKIKDIIGPGGKVIKKIVEDTGAQIDINDDGTVYIAAADSASADAAIKTIQDITAEPEVGKVYTGKVTRIMNFGAFVEFMPGREGLVHISQLAKERVEKVEDVVSVGDEIVVKLVEIDSKGRLNLSRKACLK